MAKECRCVPGTYTCGPCQKADNDRAWARMSAKDKAYDSMVCTPRYSCTCLINAPCNSCLEEDDD